MCIRDRNEGNADENDAQNGDDDEDEKFVRLVQGGRGRKRLSRRLFRLHVVRSVLQIRQPIVQMRTEQIVFLHDELKAIVMIDDDQFQQFLIEIILSVDNLNESKRKWRRTPGDNALL